MCLGDFLEQLFRDGRVEVPPGPAVLERSLAARRRLFLAFEEDGWHCPDVQPGYDVTAAEAGAAWLAAAVQCCADRSLDAGTTLRLLALPPAPTTAAEHYSADLTLRHLPDLYRMSRHLLEDDPLLSAIAAMAVRFPLSSPGIPLPGEPSADFLLSHPALRRLYLDRIVARRDVAKARHPIIAASLRESLGAHEGLVSALFPPLSDRPALPLLHGN